MIIRLILHSLLAIQVAGLPPMALPRTVADVDGYSEGIVFDSSGRAYVSLLHRGAVYQILPGGSASIWFRVDEPNGHKVLPNGTHMIAARGGVHLVGADARLLKVFNDGMVTPNDLALDGDGGVYVSVPAETEAEQQKHLSGIHYIDAKGIVSRVAAGFCYPNGIVVRADGRALFVNDSCSRQVFVFQVASPGRITNQKLFVQFPDPKSVPDGMTFDQDGRLYVADYGLGEIAVYDSTARLLQRYPTGMNNASNVAFGGAKLDSLYVTGAPINEQALGRLVLLPLGVRGRSSLARPAAILRE